jgi:hypothetical protein
MITVSEISDKLKNKNLKMQLHHEINDGYNVSATLYVGSDNDLCIQVILHIHICDDNWFEGWQKYTYNFYDTTKILEIIDDKKSFIVPNSKYYCECNEVYECGGGSTGYHNDGLTLADIVKCSKYNTVGKINDFYRRNDYGVDPKLCFLYTHFKMLNWRKIWGCLLHK